MQEDIFNWKELGFLILGKSIKNVDIVKFKEDILVNKLEVLLDLVAFQHPILNITIDSLESFYEYIRRKVKVDKLILNETVIEIVNKLRNTPSTNSKVAILKANQDNETLKKILKYTYDADMKYGITEEIITPHIKINNGSYDVFSLLDILSSSNIDNKLRVLTGEVLGSLSQEQQDLLMCILTKDLRCNISVKTIQKVWKDIIPVWEVQQAYPLEKYKLKPNELIMISEKLNGSRGSYINREIKSRQNKVFVGLQHIINDIETLGLHDYFVDGELIRNNIDNISDNENFRLSMSILNSDNKDKEEIIFRVYDILPKEEFLQGESKLRYPFRIKQLEALSEKIKENNIKNIQILPILYQGTDHTQIDKWLQWADDNGKEGCMLYRDTTYKCKRHSGILKVKSFKHCDVVCKSIYEGTGKYEGVLGGIIVDYKGFDCGCGSGLNDTQREYYFNNPNEIIGKVVQIKYKEESKNKNGGLSMQFPIFECVREYGKTVSYN